MQGSDPNNRPASRQNHEKRGAADPAKSSSVSTTSIPCSKRLDKAARTPERRMIGIRRTSGQLRRSVRAPVGAHRNPARRRPTGLVRRTSRAETRRSRLWTGPRRSCRCSLTCPRSGPTTTSATAPPPPCSPRWRSRPGRSPRPACRGTARMSSCGSSSRSGSRSGVPVAPPGGQLRHPQAPRGQGGWRAFNSVTDLISAITRFITTGTPTADRSPGPEPQTKSSLA